jgi:hypothetical protein
MKAGLRQKTMDASLYSKQEIELTDFACLNDFDADFVH